ncbi:MAG: PhzF family phenazine biosynthesis protein [Novosphingobium sp.]|nr:PhzF family phenazine biosynthesis protein [Novosphingobium sp.]
MLLDLVDVFGSRALAGNPLGVVHGGAGLDDEAMLRLTQWLGFSETTFLVPPENPEADYRVRIFYPAGELPFAGHPTLGTCHAWLRAGGKPKHDGVIVQECGVGLVEVRQENELLAFKAPPLSRTGALSDTERSEAAQLAGVPEAAVVEAVHIANGPNWQLLRLRSADDVLDAEPAAKAPEGTEFGLAGPWPEGSQISWELRAFFVPGHERFAEDPVTGSFNAGVAMHLFANGLAKDSYIAGQGQMVGADGRIHCSIDANGAVWIGGKVATIAAGGELPNSGGQA